MYASIMAALHNGPGLKKDKKPWVGSDFMKPPWRSPQAAPVLQRERKKGAKSPTRADFAGNKVR